MRLKDRVAIVTGGGKGIGAAYSARLAGEGAAVMVADIDEKAAEDTAAGIRATGATAAACRVDVSDPASTQEMVRRTIEFGGGVDILVNNAAMFANLKRGAWDSISVEEFDRVMAVNVKGVWLCCVAAVPSMKARGGGKIINIGSSSIFHGGNGLIHYLSSKMAVMGMTRSLARELGDFNICVNTIMPGSTDSGTNRANTPLEYMQTQAKNRAIKRVQVPEDLCGTLVYLASADSDFVTGQALLVDGGKFFY